MPEEEEIADTEIADETSIIDYANAAPRASIVEADIEIDPSITATCNSYSGRNLEYQNYTVWSSTVSSYLTTSPDGGLMRVQAGALDGTLLVEYYDSSYNYQRTVTVPLSLPVFGAFYESADNYYVLSGQNNTDHDDSVEVYHVTKYTKDWKALGSCGLFGANTAYPFDAGFSIAPAYYTGSEVTPEVTVTHSGKTLVKDRDFIVTYHNNIEPSSYYNSPWVGIDGIGNYQGYVTKSFTINRADISSCTVTLSDESLTYTGSSLRPTATVKSGDKELTLNQDYYVSYRNNWDAGTASAILTGTGNYTGSVTKDFTIKPLDISRYSASLSQYSYTSDGTEKCPDVTVTYGDKTLAAGTDFTVSYKDNVKEGTATVTITGAGNYTGIINTTFTITAAPGKDDSDAGKDNPGKDDSSKDDSGKDDSGKDDSGKDDSGKDDSGKDELLVKTIPVKITYPVKITPVKMIPIKATRTAA